MSVDLNIEDVTLDITLLHCRNAYVAAFRTMLHPHLPSGRKWLAFEERHSSYVDYAYWGVNEEVVKLDDLPRAGDLVEEFELLLKARQAHERFGRKNTDEFQNRVLNVFTAELLERMRDHCRDNPDSQILVSLN
ncbi:MAG: hypothetical protein NXH72_14070 [Hyphomonadaceae bacterium]|nr:hypothetical protein [Hyphomonadaceae bacterium]